MQLFHLGFVEAAEILEQVREQILDLDIDNLTPVEALMKLNEIKKVVSGSAAAKSERR